MDLLRVPQTIFKAFALLFYHGGRYGPPRAQGATFPHFRGKMFWGPQKWAPGIWGPGPKFRWQGKAFCGKFVFQIGGMGAQQGRCNQLAWQPLWLSPIPPGPPWENGFTGISPFSPFSPLGPPLGPVRALLALGGPISPMGPCRNSEDLS